MKKILFLAAVTILAAVSCNKIEEGGATTFEPSNVPSFVASVDGADTETKTIIKENMSYWNGTEEISVLDGNKYKTYTATVEEAETATFTEKDGTSLSGTTYLAVYPAAYVKDISWSGDITKEAKKLWLPNEQTPTPKSYDPKTHIAIASTSSDINVLKFKNLNALVKVTIPYENITEVSFYGNNGEITSGNFNVQYSNDNPTISTPKGDNIQLNTKTTLKAKTGSLTCGETYYISILPSTFTKGFTVEFVMDGVRYIKKLNKEYTVNRNDIISLPKIEFEAISKSGKLYLDPSDEWEKDGARFAAYFFAHTTKKGTTKTANSTWVDMTHVPNTYFYSCNVPVGYDKAIIVRMNPNTTVNDWNNKWGDNAQTGDLDIMKNSIYTVTGWMTSCTPSGSPAAISGPGMPSEWALYRVDTQTEIRMFQTDNNFFVAKNVEISSSNTQLLIKKFEDDNWSIKYGGGIFYLQPSKKTKLTKSGTDFLFTSTGTFDFYITSAVDYLYVAKSTDNYTNLAEQKYSDGKLFLKPNSNWKQSNARFAAYFMDSNKSNAAWVSMTKLSLDSNVYEVAIPSESWKYVIFCRMNPEQTANNWNNKWNQTADLEIPTGDSKGTMFTVKDGTWDKGGGSWTSK